VVASSGMVQSMTTTPVDVVALTMEHTPAVESRKNAPAPAPTLEWNPRGLSCPMAGQHAGGSVQTAAGVLRIAAADAAF
jgi:hypothetical protein